MRRTHQGLLSLMALSLLFTLNMAQAAFRNYPTNPDPRLTPGSVCQRSSQYRYPEHISYCERDVDSYTKREVISNYDRQLGYHIQSMNRQNFKIDHYIPLCMGGSNDPSNLWPQHQSVYAVTDPMEPLACEKMQAGVLSQQKAIELIKFGKNNLDKVPEVIRYLNSL